MEMDEYVQWNVFILLSFILGGIRRCVEGKILYALKGHADNVKNVYIL